MQFRLPVSSRVTLNFLQFARVGSEVSFRSDTRTGLGIQVKLNQYFSIQPTYTYQYAHPGEGRKAYSHRLFVDNQLRLRWHKVTFPTRIRIERIVRHGASDYWNHRIRPGIDVPVQWGAHKYNLFATHEIFYDTRYQVWSRNRLITGLGKKFNDRFAADFFYQHQWDDRARPGNTRTFGTTFRFQLRQEK